MAFFPGSTGVIYRQFSVTIIAAMLLSVVVALILTPVLCATFLKPVVKGHEPSENSVFFLRWFFRGFDRVFFWIRDRYVGLVGHSLAKKFRYLFVYVVLVAGVGYLFVRLPSSYLPSEDQGVLMCQIMLPVGSTLEQTKEVAKQVNQYFQDSEQETVESCMIIPGYGGPMGQAQNNAMVFVKLKDWDLRQRPDLKCSAVIDRAMQKFATINQAMIFAFALPAVMELGTAQGVELELIDRGNCGHKALMEAREALLRMARSDRRLNPMTVRANGLADVPEYRVDVNWDKAGAQGVPINAIHSTISTAFGSAYVNNFVQSERVKKVFVQADAPYRKSENDLNKLYVRNNAGKMVPYSSFATGRWSYASPRRERYNGFPSLNIVAEAAPGYSSGDAMKVMEELVEKLPGGFGSDWTGLSYQERMATAQGPVLYAFSILVIFLCVAALYESWTIPFVNLLMLPLGVLGALAATSMRGLSNDVYFQIGFLTTLGLSTKNAILIIQFIKEQQRQGKGLVEATLDAVKIRFRPVIMTSLAFFFGTLPLATATGAGAGAMNAIGTAVTGGMLSATFIDLIFIPLFYVVVCTLFAKEKSAVPLPENVAIAPS
jgi:HAE1 family hydrophobic/amphiphilic exporter-1